METKTATAKMATGWDGKEGKLITGEVPFTYQSANCLDDILDYCSGNESQVMDIINAQLMLLAKDARKAILVREHSPSNVGAEARRQVQMEQHLMSLGLAPDVIADIIAKGREKNAKLAERKAQDETLSHDTSAKAATKKK